MEQDDDDEENVEKDEEDAVVMDFRDTFLDASHVENSFPEADVVFPTAPLSAGAKSKSSKSKSSPPPPYRLKFFPPPPSSLSDGVGKERVIVEPYTAPNPGPYPQDQPLVNSVSQSFTQAGRQAGSAQANWPEFTDTAVLYSTCTHFLNSFSSFPASLFFLPAYLVSWLVNRY